MITSFIMYNNENGSGKDITMQAGLPYHGVIAHRGASYYAPENTMPSFKLAAQHSPDYLETDIQLSSDNEAILFHDDTLSRTTDILLKNKSLAESSITELSLKQIKSLDAGSWYSTKYPERNPQNFTNTEIPTFHDFLVFAKSTDCGIMLETKSPEKSPGIEKVIADMLFSHGFIDNHGRPINNDIIIQSFSAESLQKIKELMPEVKLCLLISSTYLEKYGWENRLTAASKLKASIGISGYLALPWNIRKAHKLGIPVAVYTIDSPLQLKVFKYAGADLIITNKPEETAKIFKNN